MPIIKTILSLGGDVLPMPKLESGRYSGYGSKLVGRMVKVSISHGDDSESIWVSAKEYKKGKLTGTIFQVPKQNSEFIFGEKIEFFDKDVEDVLSQSGMSRLYPAVLNKNTYSTVINQLLKKAGETKWVGRELEIWGFMTECEQDHAITLYKNLADNEGRDRGS